MLTRDVILLSFHNLFLHKVRSFLTSLGVIFGVGSVIAMLAISEGAKQNSLSQIEAMGIDNIIVFTKKPSIGSKGDSEKGTIEKFGLLEIDLENIKKMQNIKRISTVTNTRKKITNGLKQLDLYLVGVDLSFLKDTHSNLTIGRWFSKLDFKNKQLTCVIGKNVKQKLFNFNSENIIGENIKIESNRFKVVGIVENDINLKIAGVGFVNNMIFIPTPTSENLYGQYSFLREGRHSFKIMNIEYDTFLIKIQDIRFIHNTAKRIKSYLDKSHADVKDWDIIVPYELFKQKEQTQRVFSIVMGSIAGISLLVGGIGIMNIMLANVYERRKEIGTRRALGAKKRNILIQFLIETITLTSTGGLCGIALGVAIAKLVAHYAMWPTNFSSLSIILSFCISGFIGVVFGTYPAWKAAQQKPIDVLRTE